MNGNFGVTSTGFIPKQLTDILSQIQTALQGDFGANYSFSSLTPDGQLMNRFSQQLADAWQAIEQAYNGFYPSTASGVNLDQAESMTNVFRIKATATVLNGATIAGSPGTVVPNTFQIAPQSNPSLVFQLVTSVTVGGGGTVAGTFVCLTTGPNVIPASTTWNIVTPVTNITGVTNSTAAQTGSNAETDSAFRNRAAQQRQAPGSPTASGIVTYLLNNVANVSQVFEFANESDVTDSNGNTPHSIRLVVVGGVDQDIANAIYAAKGAGIATNGAVSKTVVDSQGGSHTINFDRLAQVPIYVTVNITRNTNPAVGPVFPANGVASIVAAIVAYGQSFVPNETVVQTQLFTPVNTVPGITSAVILIGTAPNPTQSVNIPLANNQVAEFLTANIVVNG